MTRRHNTGASSNLKRRRAVSQSEDEDGKACLYSGCRSERLTRPKIYNSSYRHSKPAELFRKDLISAMKLPDSEPLLPEEYWLMGDAWREEWERGVQVPVNPESLPKASTRIQSKRKKHNFKLPSKKYLRCSVDEQKFPGDQFVFAYAAGLADQTCRYDLDDVDLHWLRIFNAEREQLGLPAVDELTMELIMESLENQCFESLQAAIRSQEGLGIEYDEDVVCDVCRSPDSEDGNEMVFCDSCNICVHQACYGITSIPEGSWVCRPCAVNIRPNCSLCPNRGGAMKSTRNGNSWAHVACALWIPEVSIGCVDKMEPIIKVSQIPASRWALVCSICRERVGACIQCSVGSCKTAYHVTCAFQRGLEMKALITEGASDDEAVKLRSYCSKHSKKIVNNEPITSDEDENDDVYSNHVKEDDDDSDQNTGKRRIRKPKKVLRNRSPAKPQGDIKKEKELEVSSEEKASARLQRLKQLDEEFFVHASVEPLMDSFGEDPILLDLVYQYWKLKRRANFNRPLMTPKAEESFILERQQEDIIYARMKMFVHLRQNLERVRNLCYMVSRREKLCRSLFKMREEVFRKQASLLAIRGVKISEKEKLAVIQANHGDCIYDRLHSGDVSKFPLLSSVLCVLEGKEAVNSDLQSLPRNKFDLTNYLLPSPTKLTNQCTENICSRPSNPYAKQYANGIRRSSHRRSGLPFDGLDNGDESCNTTITSTTIGDLNETFLEKSTSDAFNRLNSVKRSLMMQLLESPSKHEEVVDTLNEEDDLRMRKVLQDKGGNTDGTSEDKLDENIPVVKSNGKENTESLAPSEDKKTKEDNANSVEPAKKDESVKHSLRSTPARETTPEKKSVPLMPTASLAGYKIPKKKKSDTVDTTRIQNSPLCEDTVTSPLDSWANGNLSPRLVIKLEKDLFSETKHFNTPRNGSTTSVETWAKSDDPFKFRIVRNDWNRDKTNHNIKGSLSLLTNKTAPRYPIRFRTLGHNTADQIS